MAVMVEPANNNYHVRDVMPPHPLEAYRYLREDSSLRRKTFKTWPSTYSYISVEDLVQEGFSYIGNGDTDKVQCAFCGGVLYGFEKGDDVHIEHYKHFPKCSKFKYSDSSIAEKFARPISGGTSSVDSRGTSDRSVAPNGDLETDGSLPTTSSQKSLRRPMHIYYATESDRLKTFKTWPKDHFLKPAQLAKAGLYYKGTGDLCECYFCGGQLDQWEEGDDPVQEHNNFFNNICPLAKDYIP